MHYRLTLIFAWLLSLSGISMGQTTTAPPASPTLQRILKSNIIKLGHRPNSSPFSFKREGADAPEGYGTDVCVAMVKAIQDEFKTPVKIEWIPTTSAERIQNIKSGAIDLECANTTITPDRMKEVRFAIPYFIAGAAVMARSDTNAKSLKDLGGKNVGVHDKSTGQKVVTYANTFNYKLNPVVVKDNADGVKALSENRVQGWVNDDVLLAVARANAPQPSDFTFLPLRHTTEPLALMMSKDDPEWSKLIDKYVSRLMRSGDMEKIYTRWFMQPIAPKNININLPPSRYLKELFKQPSRMDFLADTIKL